MRSCLDVVSLALVCDCACMLTEKHTSGLAGRRLYVSARGGVCMLARGEAFVSMHSCEEKSFGRSRHRVYICPGCECCAYLMGWSFLSELHFEVLCYLRGLSFVLRLGCRHAVLVLLST